MNTQNILNAYTLAKERYAALGIDTDQAIATLEKTPISLHCWQTDDVMGFESNAEERNASTCMKSTATSEASSSTAIK